jgi:hypothetical protein
MKRSLELSQHRRANVWLDENPPADFTASSIVSRLVKPTILLDVSRKLAGVELKIPRGPKTSYALLGAELAHADVEGLEVLVSVNKAGFPLQSPLAPKPEEVRIGLLEEYPEAVIRGVEKVADAVGAPTGAVMRFRWAAHGVVGSSESVFEQAGGIVARLLSLPDGASDERIRALFG